MEVEKITLETEVHYSDDRYHRYLISKVWDSKAKQATIIMLNPSTASSLAIDMTTMYIINNISKLGFGGVEIVNIFSKLNEEINNDICAELLTDKTNDQMIVASVARTDTTILAWGKGGETNKQVQLRIKAVRSLLKEYNHKLYEICDDKGRHGWHPLAPSIRFGWALKKMEIEDDEREIAKAEKVTEQTNSEVNDKSKSQLKDNHKSRKK